MTAGRIRAVLVGASATEIVFLLGVWFVVIAFLALGSNVKGLGYDDCRTCTGPGEREILTLNPVLFLPYVLADKHTGIVVGGPAVPALADVFALTPDLYAWTMVWWLLLAYLVARFSSAVGFWLPRRLSTLMFSR